MADIIKPSSSVTVKLGKHNTEPITYTSKVIRTINGNDIEWLFKGFSTPEDALLYAYYSYINGPSVPVFDSDITYNIPKFPYEFKELDPIEYEDFAGNTAVLVNESLVFEKASDKKKTNYVGLKYNKDGHWYRLEMWYHLIYVEKLKEFVKYVNNK